MLPILINTLRQYIQDIPTEETETFIADGETKIFQLASHPIIDYPFSLIFTEESPEEEEEEEEEEFTEESLEEGFTLIKNIGKLKFDNPPEQGIILEVNYFTAQLSDEELEACLNSALVMHDSDLTWDTLESSETPFIIWLAAASAFYMLAAKWATRTRIKVETVDIHNQHIGGSYFKMAQTMEQRYKEASTGQISISSFTRRDVRTGLLVPLPEVFYGE